MILVTASILCALYRGATPQEEMSSANMFSNLDLETPSVPRVNKRSADSEIDIHPDVVLRTETGFIRREAVPVVSSSASIPSPSPEEWTDMLDWIADGMPNFVSATVEDWADWPEIPTEWPLWNIIAPLAAYKSELFQFLQIAKQRPSTHVMECFNIIRRAHPKSKMTRQVFKNIFSMIFSPTLAHDWFHALLLAYPTASPESLADHIVNGPFPDFTHRDRNKVIHSVRVWRHYCLNMGLPIVRQIDKMLALPLVGQIKYLADLQFIIDELI